MTKEEILQEIAALDRQINQQVAQQKLPRLNMKYSRFPWATWIAAVVFFGLWLYGGMFIPENIFDIGQYVAFGLGVLFVLAGLWRTIMFLFKGRQKTDSKYAAATEKVRMLQEKRQELQEQLDEMQKK